MNAKNELVGKTISGIVAVRDQASGPVEIWMMQFTDGSHVEFVSPTARRRLRAAAGTFRRTTRTPVPIEQLALNVA